MTVLSVESALGDINITMQKDKFDFFHNNNPKVDHRFVLIQTFAKWKSQKHFLFFHIFKCILDKAKTVFINNTQFFFKGFGQITRI